MRVATHPLGILDRGFGPGLYGSPLDEAYRYYADKDPLAISPSQPSVIAAQQTPGNSISTRKTFKPFRTILCMNRNYPHVDTLLFLKTASKVGGAFCARVHG